MSSSAFESFVLDELTIFELNKLDGTTQSDDISDIGSMIKAFAVENKESITESSFALLNLLFEICGMALDANDINCPYKSRMTLTDGRRTLCGEDLTEQDLDVLEKTISEIRHPALHARVADLLWTYKKKKHPEHARQAIDSFMMQRVIVNDFFQFLTFIERAFGLAKSINDSSRKESIRQYLMDQLTADTTKFSFAAYRIVDLMSDIGCDKGNELIIAKRLFEIGEETSLAFDNDMGSRYFSKAARYYHVAKDNEKSSLSYYKSAVCMVEHAKEQAKRSQFVYASFLEDAVQIYRKIPSKYRTIYDVDERIKEVRSLMNDASMASRDELGVFPFEIEKHLEDIEAAKKHVSGKRLDLAILHFAHVHAPLKYSDLVAIEEKSSQSSFLSSVFGRTYTNEAGHVIAKTKPGENEGVKVIETYLHLNLHIVPNLILPGLEQLTYEHRVEFQFLYELCMSSPIVPKDHAGLIAKGLYNGFNMDFSIAIHILAPQLENIIRQRLKLVGVETTHLDKQGIQNEIGLSSLIEIDETKILFGVDRAFEIEALFCSPFGPNFRNHVAHGVLKDGAGFHEVYAWWFILRLICQSIAFGDTGIKTNAP